MKTHLSLLTIWPILVHRVYLAPGNSMLAKEQPGIRCYTTSSYQGMITDTRDRKTRYESKRAKRILPGLAML